MKKEKNIISLFKDMNIYMKERLVIGIVLVCFAISGISLPIIKEKIYKACKFENAVCTTNETEDNTNDIEIGESGSGFEDANDIEDDGSSSGSENTNDKDDIETDRSYNGAVNSDSPKDGEKEANSKEGTKNNGVKDKNADGKDASPSANNPSPKPTITPAATSPAVTPPVATPPASADSSTSPEKIWVPPVYKIVHHEAVYETRKVYICNYCSAEFNSAGEFQVHKDENGG